MGKAVDKPRVLTDKVQQELVKLIAEGNYLEPSCRAVGISVDTFYYWKHLYEDGVKHAQMYADFFGAYARAQGIAETSALGGIRSGRMGWQGEAWFLERRFRSRWGSKLTSQEDLDDAEPKDDDGNPIEP